MHVLVQTPLQRFAHALAEDESRPKKHDQKQTYAPKRQTLALEAHMLRAVSLFGNCCWKKFLLYLGCDVLHYYFEVGNLVKQWDLWPGHKQKNDLLDI